MTRCAALAGTVTLLVVGCVARPGVPPTAETRSAQPTGGAAAGPIFALCPKALNNPYFDLVRKGANAAADRLKIPEPQWVGATEADAAKQVAAINDVISRGVNGIALSPNAPEAVNAASTRARDKKIPVVCFDADAPGSRRQVYIGTDNLAAGKKAGIEMARLLGGGGLGASLLGRSLLLGAGLLGRRLLGGRSLLGRGGLGGARAPKHSGRRLRVAGRQEIDVSPLYSYGVRGDIIRKEIERAAARKVEACVMPMTRENAVVAASAVERKAHMRTTVVQGEDTPPVLQDEDRSMWTAHHEAALALELLNGSCIEEFGAFQFRLRTVCDEVASSGGSHYIRAAGL